ncbi:MAG TPA: hypothetical protein VFV67_13990 [Actinophytocola sp.]|uniref:hypothetical protein n=1 Tax=Actinophytocola sp. TaxID=1872138 RepID=UPI002DB8354A|nr:hypothetical protein [Actinophytocola sp.]HEU5471758.1 hypothetical protein [Actinophytocola sp.]
MVEVVGYELRTAAQQDDVEHRLRTVVAGILGDVRVDPELAQGTDIGGARVVVLLPATADPARVLPGLLMAAANRLAQDNARFRDRLRLRMAIGSGPEELNRLVDSDPLRMAVARYPEADVLVLVSGTVHAEAGRLEPGIGRFRRVVVGDNEFTGVAWLWVGPD